MRKAGLALALALVATSQLTLLSSPAFADGAAASGSLSLSGGSDGASASASGTTSGGDTSAPAADSGSSDKKTTGWILVGVGGAVAVGGIVIDVVGANSGSVAGMGGGSDNSNTDNTRTDLLFLGTTLIVAGLVTGIYGGSFVWNADHNAASKSTPPPQEQGKTDGVTRAVEARLASAPTFTIPLVGARF